MNGPRIVCAGCGEPTTEFKPICDKCLTATGETPRAFCALCEAGLVVDKVGVHTTRNGGYAGKCTAVSIAGDACKS